MKLLLLALALPCAALSPDTALSPKVRKEIARLQALAETSPAARRLLAATRRVPRREERHTEYLDAIAVRGGAKPMIVFDAARLGELTEADTEILLVLAAARASVAFPVPVVETEQYAWQRAVQFAVERGAEDPAGFGAILAKAEREAGAGAAALERSALPPRSLWEPEETPALKLPASPLARAALLLHLLDLDPQRFYWAVERGTAWPAGSARLSELEDLFALRGKDLAAMKAPLEGPYAVLGGRRYPVALARAAFLLRGTGEVERLRESLEAYDTVGLTGMKYAINRWRRTASR